MIDNNCQGTEKPVQFNDGNELWLPDSQLISSTNNPEQKITISQDSKTRTNNKNRQFYREVIEALRLGGVPQDRIIDFTCGRENELNRINKWLDENRGSIVIEGEYGAGKSHLINIVAEKALLNNWAVARVEIDPQENAFNRPRNIYNCITESFSYYNNEERKNFDDFLKNISDDRGNPDINCLNENKIFEGFLDLCDCQEYNDSITDWMKGKVTSPVNQNYHLPKMLGTQVSANIYSYIISTLGWICKNIYNLKGLLILFDEAESIDSNCYSSYQYRQSENMIRGLIKMSDSDPALKNEKLNNYIGVKTGLKYCGQNKQQYPFLWADTSYVKLLFSFVPGMIDSLYECTPLKLDLDNLEVIEINELEKYEMAKLYKKIVDAYLQAYDFKTEHNLLPELPTDKTRIFVKSTVEALDLSRFHPYKKPEEYLRTYDDLC